MNQQLIEKATTIAEYQVLRNFPEFVQEEITELLKADSKFDFKEIVDFTIEMALENFRQDLNDKMFSDVNNIFKTSVSSGLFGSVFDKAFKFNWSISSDTSEESLQKAMKDEDCTIDELDTCNWLDINVELDEKQLVLLHLQDRLYHLGRNVEHYANVYSIAINNVHFDDLER